MGNEIIVTVGLCVKNDEVNVAEAIDSIINQDFPHKSMELIVVDGFSQDNTLSIINERIQKTHIRYKVLQERQGLGYARQMVVNNASGDYIIWVDGDIILTKEYIRKQIDFMNSNPKVGGVLGSYGFLPEDNLVAALENIGYVINSLNSKEGPSKKLLSSEASCHRTKAVREVGGFDTKIKGAGEDVDLSYRLKSKGWLLYENSPIFYEKQRRTWKELWKQYFWYGYGNHYIQHKKTFRFTVDRSVDTAIISSVAYKATHKKIVFLLPLNFVFTTAATFAGYIVAHLDGYGHHNIK